ncbi:MAG: hypothetical protein M0R37_15465 [Bacteroidales bacterium]|nr:hypothetical protein [Bacteroidales bacterium]
MSQVYTQEELDAFKQQEEKERRDKEFFHDNEARNLVLLALDKNTGVGSSGKAKPHDYLVEVVGGPDEGRQHHVKDYSFDQAIRDIIIEKGVNAVNIGSTVVNVTPHTWKKDEKWGDKFNFDVFIVDPKENEVDAEERRKEAAANLE